MATSKTTEKDTLVLGLAVLMEQCAANYSWPVAVVSTIREAREIAAARQTRPDSRGAEYRLYYQDEHGEYSRVADIEVEQQ